MESQKPSYIDSPEREKAKKRECLIPQMIPQFVISTAKCYRAKGTLSFGAAKFVLVVN